MVRQSQKVIRWVAPVDGKIPRTQHGLLDSETLSRDWYAGVRPRRSDNLIGSRNSYVLLAPSGAGKTTLVEDLQSREPASTSIDLRLHVQQSFTELLNLLPSGSPAGNPRATVFVDSVDEALQLDPNIGYVLVKLVGHSDLDHIAWRFACRPSSWTVDLTDGLSATLPGFEVLELLPLGLPELREMAGEDADDFLEAVEQAGLTRLLAHPLHASNLLEDWRASRRMPADRSVAMQHAVARMLTETSSTRPLGALDDQRRRLIVERLAATSMFCSVGSYAVRSAQPAACEGKGSSISVNSLPTHIEPDLGGSPLNATDFREVLGTAMFSATGRGAVTFAHQSYAEFLAAAYLVRRGVTGQRLISLLGADTNGLVPGAMIEVLGWLLASGAPIPEVLIAENAKQLLGTAGLELVNDQVRERIVAALLHGAEIGTIDEGWRVDTSVLSHPGLATQLHEAAENASNLWLIYWVCRIARQCTVHETTDDLLTIAMNPAWSDAVRAEAVRAFAEVAPRDRLPELAPLMDLGSGEDPLDEILAATLRAVLPDAIDFHRIRSAIRPRRTSNFIGAYYLLLSELSILIPTDGVVPALTDALRRQPKHRDRAFDDLIGGLLRRAWEMRDPQVVHAVGTALGSNRFGFPWALRSGGLPWETDDDPDLRRAMAAAALAADEHAYATIPELRILTASDLVWLIDWIQAAPAEALDCAQIVLRNLAWTVNDSVSAEHILSVGQDHPAYQSLAAFHGHQQISSRPARLAHHSENVEAPSLAESASQLRGVITHSRTEVNDWWHAVNRLADNNPEQLLNWDLTSRPLWSTMDREEQEEILQQGVDYLNTRQPEASRWAGQSQLVVDDVMPDWAAVFLLATLAARRVELFADVEPTTWTSWASAIILMPSYLAGDGWLRRIRDAAPEVGREAIDGALRQHVRDAEARISLADNPFANFSDQRLISVIEQIARGTGESLDRRNEAMGLLVEHAPDVALDIARAAMNDEISPPSMCATLAKLAPEELIAEWVAEGHLGPLESLHGLNATRLSDSSLATLAAMLLDKLPFADDPDEPLDFTERTPESVARNMRMVLLQSMSSRGMSSALVALAHGRPAADVDRIRHLLQEARTHEAVANWRPLQPATLMNVIASGDARLVRDSAGLMTVLREQLDEIQNDIHLGEFRSLWDSEPGSEGASPKVEDTISDWLANQLRLRLQPHVVVDREIQVARRRPAGIGTRIDITATSGGVEIGRVVFEAKRVNNPKLLTAINDQLVGQYMDPAAFSDGIYIVYWTAPKLRPSSWHGKHPDMVVLADQLRAQAQSHLPHRRIEVVVLDIGPAV
jgi:hypothetical protein